MAIQGNTDVRDQGTRGIINNVVAGIGIHQLQEDGKQWPEGGLPASTNWRWDFQE